MDLKWKEVKLSDAIQYMIGGDWGKDPHEISDKDYTDAYCIRGAELREWVKDKGKTATLRSIKKESVKTRQLLEGDIIVEISGGGPDQPVGRTAYIDKDVLKNFAECPVVCTNFFRLIRLSNEVDRKYVDYYLKYFYKIGKIVNYQGGSNNLRNLRFNDFISIDIPLPPLKEQNRIVQKLDKLFAKIEGIEDQMANVLSYKDELIMSFLFNANNSSEGYETLEDYIEEGNKRIGDSWLNVSKIGVSSADGITELRTGQKKTFERYKVVKPGDFIYNTMRVNIGSIARYKGTDDAITSPDYVVFRVKDKLSPELLLNYLKSERGKLEINSKTRGGVRSRLYYNSMRQIRIPNITVEQHIQAEKLFLFFRDYIEKHKTLLNYFEDLKSSILDKAFCGELAPQNPKDEPVERLLERIIQEKSKLKKKTKKLSLK